MTRAKAITKPGRRSFDGKAFEYDLELALDAIALVVGKRITEVLADRVTDAEVKDLSKKTATIALLGLLGNPNVMRHVADARTSRDKRKLRKGKPILLVESQMRAVELKNENMSAKNILRKLVTEEFATIRSDESIQLKGVKRAIPDSSWDSRLTYWKKKVKDGA